MAGSNMMGCCCKKAPTECTCTGPCAQFVISGNSVSIGCTNLRTGVCQIPTHSPPACNEDDTMCCATDCTESGSCDGTYCSPSGTGTGAITYTSYVQKLLPSDFPPGGSPECRSCNVDADCMKTIEGKCQTLCPTTGNPTSGHGSATLSTRTFGGSKQVRVLGNAITCRVSGPTAYFDSDWVTVTDYTGTTVLPDSLGAGGGTATVYWCAAACCCPSDCEGCDPIVATISGTAFGNDGEYTLSPTGDPCSWRYEIDREDGGSLTISLTCTGAGKWQVTIDEINSLGTEKVTTLQASGVVCCPAVNGYVKTSGTGSASVTLEVG